MRKHATCFFVLAVLLIASQLLAGSSSVAGTVTAPYIKVMSFNIRYGTANDGDNSWPLRRGLVADTIRIFDPDLLGMQEVLDFQADYLREQLSGYTFHGVGRDDGQRKGEFVPIMFRSDRFELIDAGHFWLSETPDAPGSKSWDSSLTRMVSWVILADRRTGARLVFGNTHFDHRGPQARLESARLIRRRAAEVEDRYPAILTGDFNTTEDSEPYRILLQGAASTAKPWIDTYRVIHPTRSPLETTFGSWKGVREGSRIDFILHTREFSPLNAALDYTNDAGRFPSDHYPVEAVLRMK